MELAKNVLNMRDNKVMEKNVVQMSVRTKKLKSLILMVSALNVMTITVLIRTEESAFKIHALEKGKN